MGRVLAMMVALSMVALVVAQSREESFWKEPEPTPSPPSPPEEAPPAGGGGGGGGGGSGGGGGGGGGDDCGKDCEVTCWIWKHVPTHYAICLDLCKGHCKQFTVSDAIHNCTFACADSMATKFGSDKEDYVDVCFNKCRKKGN
ncbi:small cysteine and glycine repeat-containing protein 8-like [Carya illinoinensis]|uniref:small cysteine and glycine repeat-containing protein 8-like n=1 Tax=Carya illinoinensis TaxID=32201 RepID=UPI001C7185ED|nr:small cysteine and glycine repeat-containing protein 8-like [Carya illinoinensis]